MEKRNELVITRTSSLIMGIIMSLMTDEQLEVILLKLKEGVEINSEHSLIMFFANELTDEQLNEDLAKRSYISKRS